MEYQYQQNPTARAILSPALRGVLDALDDTRTAAELQALMKPYFEDMNCSADTVWQIWNEKKQNGEMEEMKQRKRPWSGRSLGRSKVWGKIRQIVRKVHTE